MSEQWREGVGLLDAYLDDLLSPIEIELFLDKSDDRQELVKQKQLQAQIDESIRKGFQPTPFNADQYEQIIAKVDRRVELNKSQLVIPAQRRNWLLATAAVILLSISASYGIWNITANWQTDTPSFQPRPLVAIYLETTERNFKPYYECHDEERFAGVFENRINQALRLTDMPDGSRMLGISYLGGVSRKMTAVLCEVDGEPVIVFIDQLEHDQPEIALTNSNPSLEVNRVVKKDLVFYEVSIFDSPRMIKYFEILE